MSDEQLRFKSACEIDGPKHPAYVMGYEAAIDSRIAGREFNKSGSKYLRDMPCLVDGKADVYAVIDAFNVTCPARQHAIKKLLCSGIRGKGDTLQDLREAADAIARAIQMQESKAVISDERHSQ